MIRLEKRVEGMKFLTIVMLLLSIVWAEKINSKMIISSHIESEEAAKSLYSLEKFFQENHEANLLKKTHNLILGMELLDKYTLVTINKIKIQSVENTLQYLLKEKFPHSFIVHNYTDMQSQVIKKHKNTTDIQNPQKELSIQEAKDKNLFDRIDREWIALILLALAVLILVFRNMQQLAKIKKLQKEVAKYQIILEDEIDCMKVSHG
jgi:hypothetical protein